jgi:4-diphosphocytidyl-2-C-methyl-D-erythritol kinase
VRTLPLRALAPAKVNLGLFLGPLRADGRHELVSVMQSISLADELTLEWVDGGTADAGGAVGVGGAAGVAADGGDSGAAAGAVGVARDPAPGGVLQDEVVCPGVSGSPGENLAAAALAAFREATAWRAPPLRLTIAKRIPVAAGLGGGSADAAAALRLARHASGLGDEELLRELATALGADVPAQVSPGRWLASGAGEHLHPLPDPTAAFGVLVLPLAAKLSTAAVYAEADRLGLARAPRELERLHGELRAALELGAPAPAERELHNDLQQAAVSLCPQIETALAQAREAGAEEAFVSGSGPTVVGLFLRANGLGRAERAVAALAGREPAPICAQPVGNTFARPTAQCVTISRTTR